MKDHDSNPWRHEHVFLSSNQIANERRTWLVIALTATMMVLEITADNPRPPEFYKKQLGKIKELRHITVEVNSELDKE